MAIFDRLKEATRTTNSIGMVEPTAALSQSAASQAPLPVASEATALATKQPQPALGRSRILAPGAEIRLLGPDGAILSDARYRTPVELWGDRDRNDDGFGPKTGHSCPRPPLAANPCR